MVAYAAMIVGVLGFAGLAVDVGYLQYQKRRIQSAADAAAMGALREMERGNTDLVAAGQNDSSLNGFSNGVDSTTVTISSPPTSGSYSGVTTAVQATVTRNVPTFFMQILGQRGVQISAQAVAQTSTTAGSIGGCIFVLAGSGSGTFTIHGTPQLETACSVVINSTDPQALTMDGTSQILLDNGAKVGVVGQGAGTGWLLNGNPQIYDNQTHVAEQPVNIQPFTDPLASAAAPTTAGNYTIQPQGGTQIVQHNAPAALNPGVYCGGLNIHSTGGTLILNSGTYIIAGGGITIDSTATVHTAPLVNGVGGVMFYNTSSNTGTSDRWGCSGGAVAAGGMTINGKNSLNLTALTTTDANYVGATSPIGVLFFDDRSATGLSHAINGTGTDTFDGAIYVKNAALNFIGTSSTGGYLVIVTNTLDIGGTSGLGNDYTTLANVYTIAPASTGGGLVQ